MPEPERAPEPRRQDGRARDVVARSLRRLSRSIVWTAAVLAALLLLAWLLSYALERPLTAYMQRSVNLRLKGYTASVGRAHFSPFDLSMTLWDVQLIQDAYPEPPIAQFPHVWADLEWTSLLHGRIVAKFEFAFPVIHLDRNL